MTRDHTIKIALKYSLVIAIALLLGWIIGDMKSIFMPEKPQILELENKASPCCEYGEEEELEQDLLNIIENQ